MDSDDERALNASQEEEENEFPVFVLGTEASELELRLYELEERGFDMLRKYEMHSPYLDNQTLEMQERLSYAARGIPYSFMRFCETLKGFHTGRLDLSGRHLTRYESICRRWEDFVPPLMVSLEAALPVPGQSDSEISDTAENTPQPTVNVAGVAQMKTIFEKWQLPLHALRTVFKLVESTLVCLDQNPEPIIQGLCLLDLPSEMLREITRHVRRKDLANFGSTCKVLREMAWQQMNEDCTLAIDIGRSLPDPRTTEDMSQEERFELTRLRALAERERFFRATELVYARRDIAQGIRRLHFNVWENDYIRTMYVGLAEGAAELDRRIVSRMRDVLLRTTRVTKLSLTNVTLDAELLVAILSLPRLSFLKLDHCAIDLGDHELQVAPSKLATLVLVNSNYTRETTSSQWQILPYLSSLRSLLIKGSTKFSILPPVSLAAQSNPFATLERLHISSAMNRGSEFNDPETLLLLLHDPPALHLTHVKLWLPSSLRADETLSLIDALARAPLRVLVLEGLNAVPVALLERVGRACTGLVGLTLLFRESPLQRRLRDARWPGAAWQYAAALAPLRRLAHFGWNFRARAEASAAALVHLEEGPCAGECAHAEELDGTADERESVVAVFAARCPALRTLAFYKTGIYASSVWEISRREGHKPSFHLHRKLSPKDPMRSLISEVYNPEPLETWPGLRF